MRRIDAELRAAVAESEAIRRSPEYKAARAAELATLCRDWRQAADLPVARAAIMLGMSKRTYEGIEQGRGFAYPVLLALAIEAFRSSPGR